MQEVLDRLRAGLGPSGFTEDPADLDQWLTDWRGRITGRALAMVSPSTVDEARLVVTLAGERGIPLVPQGGNTSMVAGAVPGPEGEALLLSMRRMRRIRSISREDSVLVAEAGVILTEVHEAAAASGLLFPLSLAAKGSATVGGLVSTNAGGVQVLRYGTMRALTLGIEAVLADGTIHHGLAPLRKDNRGYDLKQLLIGAEGTLGLVTAATLRLVPRPVSSVTAWVALDRIDASLSLLRKLEEATGGQVTSFELIPQEGIDLVLRHIAGARAPLESRHDWHVLIDIDSSHADDSLDRITEAVLARSMESGDVVDAVIATSDAQASALWQIRETLPEAERREGGAVKHDVAVPVSVMPAFIRDVTPIVETRFPGARVFAFGHLGDGNIHFNIRAPREGDQDEWLRLNMDAAHRLVHDEVAQRGGTLSAEHGIGVLKRDEFVRLAEPGQLQWMHAIKQALDPRGIFNPGKLLPPCA